MDKGRMGVSRLLVSTERPPQSRILPGEAAETAACRVERDRGSRREIRNDLDNELVGELEEMASPSVQNRS